MKSLGNNNKKRGKKKKGYGILVRRRCAFVAEGGTYETQEPAVCRISYYYIISVQYDGHDRLGNPFQSG